MPVSTRSQISTNPDEHNSKQELGLSHRNPHHGLKEKMKALTLLYEQQKRETLAPKNPNFPRFSTHPSIDLLSSTKRDDKNVQNDSKESKNGNVLRENTIPTANCPNSTVTRTYVFPKPQSEEEAKENVGIGGDRIIGFTCPRKADVARKLSMVPQTEPRGIGETRNAQEMEKLLDKNGVIGSLSGSRIMVYVRLRPMAKKEREGGSRCCVRIVNGKDVYLTEFATENDYLRLKRLRGRHFTFDASFSETTTQQEVYSTTTAELVEAVLQGRNGSVFCYGATGAGKTYTMLGTVENPGVMVLAIKDLFNKIRQRSCDGNHVVHLSYLEVYNETVRDLISPGRPLILREDKQGIVAAGLTQYRAYTTDEVMALLQQGNRNRTTEPTRCNETSSRSHAILQVAIEYRAKDAFDNVVNRVGKLSLIDLAGSERALATEQRTLRSLEGANINRSLLALSSCINALVEGKKHIPYRNSKLTQLLKDSLGGACNTVMIANISPSNLSFGETQNTLHWADRAKEIRTKACEVNEEVLQVPDSETDQAKLLLELQKENRELRVQLARQQQKLLTIQAQSLAANTSPAPSSLLSLLSPSPSAQPNEKHKTRSTFLSRTCFTPESKKRGYEMVKELKQTVKGLEAEMQKMRREHLLLIKQKDDIIRDLSTRAEKQVEGAKKRVVVTRASLRPKTKTEGDLKSPSHRFLSPAPTAKKRSFWDITPAHSPSVVTVKGRKTRSHVSNEPAAAPSKLLQLAYPCFWSLFMFGPHLANKIMQPGFARQRL